VAAGLVAGKQEILRDLRWEVWVQGDQEVMKGKNQGVLMESLEVFIGRLVWEECLGLVRDLFLGKDREVEVARGQGVEVVRGH
jgi:hypothetical protein